MKTLLSLALLGCLYLSCSIKQAGIIKAPQTNSSSTTDRYNNAVTDDFWTAPQKPYEERRNLYLKYSSANAQVEGRDAVFPEIAKMELGIPVDEKMIRSAIAFVYTGRDCNDFTIGGLVRLMYLDKKSSKLSPQLINDVEKCLVDFKYWWDEPIKDIQYRCYHTENHQALYHTDELLAGQLLKDKTFKNGKKGKEHVEHALLRLERWLNFRTQFGFSEWLSNSYYDVDLMTLSNLYDFAEDPAIRSRAGLLMDVLMYDMSLNNYKGVFGSTHGRAYANSIKGGWKESTSSITKLMFGVGVFNSPRSMGAVSLATSSYRCPEIIESIATNYSETIRSRQRQSINVDDAEKYGLSFNNELDTHLFWGMQEFIHPKVVRMSQKISEKYDTWPYKNYDYYIKEYENQVKNFGKIANPNLDQFALSEANIETYRTPDYMLSCAQDYRKGSKGYQQHIWQATLGVDAVVFTNHPGSRQENVTPNLWAGNVSMPRAAQFKNVLVSIYHIPPKSGQPYSHAYFPKNAFNEVVEKGNWVFGRKDNGYIALYSQNPVRWGTDKDGMHNELVASATDNVWICEMGSKKQWKSFSKFIAAISLKEIKSDSLSIAYNSPSIGTVEFGWSQPFTVAGKNVPLNNYPRFENRFSQTEFTATQVLIKNKKDELILDFDKGLRIVSSNRNSQNTTGVVQFSSDLMDWPKGSSPKEVGKRVAYHYLKSPHTNFGFPTPPGSITYSEVCTWFGALKFANVTNDKNLTKQLDERFRPLLYEKNNLMPKPDHVDHTVFGTIPLELYMQTRNDIYLGMGKWFADEQWRMPLKQRPEYNDLLNKGLTWQTRMWIDDMYMITAIQAQAYRATGDRKYIDRAAKEMVVYLNSIQRPNGLFYHAADVPFFWGRGNGWMAAGMTELLSSLPNDNADRKRILEGYRTMMKSLKSFQSEDGTWRQIVDDSTSWAESSCTGMFTYAMVSGVKNGWLDKNEYGPVARKGWLALVKFIDENADVKEVCEGTNKKNDRQYYLDRKRITGDMHGQAPVLWCATALLR